MGVGAEVGTGVDADVGLGVGAGVAVRVGDCVAVVGTGVGGGVAVAGTSVGKVTGVETDRYPDPSYDWQDVHSARRSHDLMMPSKSCAFVTAHACATDETFGSHPPDRPLFVYSTAKTGLPAWMNGSNFGQSPVSAHASTTAKSNEAARWFGATRSALFFRPIDMPRPCTVSTIQFM